MILVIDMYHMRVLAENIMRDSERIEPATKRIISTELRQQKLRKSNVYMRVIMLI